MPKAGQAVTLTLTREQSKLFAAALGAPDTTLLNVPANRVDVEGYRGDQGDGEITLYLRVARISPKHKIIRNPLKRKTRAKARGR
jgi:hypothetical protein